MLETAAASVVGGVLLAQALVLLLKPSLWIEWLVARPWKPFGVTVTIVDAVRLRRTARLLGIAELALLGVAVYVYTWSCGTNACRP